MPTAAGTTQSSAPQSSAPQSRVSALIALALGLAFQSALSTVAAPPPNDTFAGRIPLSGSAITFAGTLAEANPQPEVGEPQGHWFLQFPNSSGDSVWWTWTASEATNVAIYPLQTSNHSGDDWLDVLQGTNLVTLTPVAGTLIGHLPFRHVSFTATAGTEYQVRVGTGPFATVAPEFSMRLIATNAPIILEQPKSQAVAPGASALFNVIVAGWRPFQYQWFYNDIPLWYETNLMLALHHVLPTYSGRYSVLVTQNGRSQRSADAVLQVRLPTMQPSLRALQVAGGSFEFELSGETGRTYWFEFSSNLLDWVDAREFPSSVHLVEPRSPYTQVATVLLPDVRGRYHVPSTSAPKFLRAKAVTETDVQGSEKCLNQLRQINLAKYMWATELRQPGSSVR